ncbi:MAG: ABC transporter substrate-binding protein, partial [Desulfomonilia bacterium]
MTSYHLPGSQSFNRILHALGVLFCILWPSGLCAAELNVGTWKTPQTIQPFFYGRFMDSPDTVEVFSFTNPSDQRLALLAGTLDMCGTTIAHALHSASRGEPIVIVASLCNKCSALVVKKDGGVSSVAHLKGKKIGYVPGTMHEILLRETLNKHGLH